MTRIRTFLIFGVPGSGKGTQGKLLGTLPELVHVACGDVFRSLDLTTDIGKVFLDYSSRGELVPDDVTVGFWHIYIKSLIDQHQFHPSRQILVLDGIPRNRSQAELMDPYLDVQKAIILEDGPDRGEIIRRLKSRALKENRIDDANEETIAHRLEIFDREVNDLLSFYPSEKIFRVNALQPAVCVARDILTAVAGQSCYGRG